LRKLTSSTELEATWIDFQNRDVTTYQIKVYVGGVNAISGEPFDENVATRRRRKEKMTAAQNDKNGEAKMDDEDADEENGRASPLQDYIVVPGQYWLDGIATRDGTVRQFITMPFGSGHSVESQITGQDTTGGIQFEIMPYNTALRGPPVTLTGKPYQTLARTPSGATITLRVCETTTIHEVKELIAYHQWRDTVDYFSLSF
jgi:hypothetical protein